MKAVLQRVLSASVAVDGKTISSIGRGLLVLVGIDRHDTPSDSTTLIRKILSAKLFDDAEEGKMWRKSVKDIDGEVLCVSQFTLLAQFKGAKPDFHESMSTIPGKAFYTAFLEEMGKAYHPDKIKDGEFGAMMQVSLCNDGPVTILLSSLDSRSGGTKSRSAISSGVQTPVEGISAAAAAASEGLKKAKGKGADKGKKKGGERGTGTGEQGDTGPTLGRAEEAAALGAGTGEASVSEARRTSPSRKTEPTEHRMSSLSVS